MLPTLLFLTLAVPGFSGTAKVDPHDGKPQYHWMLAKYMTVEMWDSYWTAECLETGKCREANPLIPTVEHRVAVKVAIPVVLAAVSYEVEAHTSGWRHWLMRGLRYFYFTSRIAVGIHNWRQAERVR